MNWKNAQIDDPPEDGEEVLVSVDGIYYLTRYDASEGVYRLKDALGQYFSPSESTQMYWLELNGPRIARDDY